MKSREQENIGQTESENHVDFYKENDTLTGSDGEGISAVEEAESISLSRDSEEEENKHDKSLPAQKYPKTVLIARDLVSRAKDVLRYNESEAGTRMRDRKQDNTSIGSFSISSRLSSPTSESHASSSSNSALTLQHVGLRDDTTADNRDFSEIRHSFLSGLEKEEEITKESLDEPEDIIKRRLDKMMSSYEEKLKVMDNEVRMLELRKRNLKENVEKLRNVESMEAQAKSEMKILREKEKGIIAREKELNEKLSFVERSKQDVLECWTKQNTLDKNMREMEAKEKELNAKLRNVRLKEAALADIPDRERVIENRERKLDVLEKERDDRIKKKRQELSRLEISQKEYFQQMSHDFEQEMQKKEQELKKREIEFEENMKKRQLQFDNLQEERQTFIQKKQDQIKLWEADYGKTIERKEKELAQREDRLKILTEKEEMLLKREIEVSTLEKEKEQLRRQQHDIETEREKLEKAMTCLSTSETIVSRRLAEAESIKQQLETTLVENKKKENTNVKLSRQVEESQVMLDLQLRELKDREENFEKEKNEFLREMKERKQNWESLRHKEKSELEKIRFEALEAQESAESSLRRLETREARLEAREKDLQSVKGMQISIREEEFRLEMLKKNVASKQEVFTRQMRNFKSEKGSIEELNSKLDELRTEKSNLQKRCEELEKLKHDSELVRQQAEEVSRKTKELNRREVELDMAKSEIAETKQARANLEKLTRSRENEIRQATKEMKAAIVAKTEADSIKIKYKQLEKDVKEREARVLAYEKRMTDLDNRDAKLTNEKIELESALVDVQEREKKLKKDLSTLRARTDRADRLEIERKNQYESSMKEIEVKMDEVKAKERETRKQMEKEKEKLSNERLIAMKKQSEVENMRQNFDRLVETFKIERTKVEKEIDSERRTLENERMEIDELVHNIELEKEQLKSNQAEVHEEKRLFSIQVAEWRKEQIALQQEANEVMQEVSDERKKIEEEREQITALRQELTQGSISHKTAMMENIRLQEAQLEESRHALEESKRKVSKSQREIDEMRNELDRQKKDLENSYRKKDEEMRSHEAKFHASNIVLKDKEVIIAQKEQTLHKKELTLKAQLDEIESKIRQQNRDIETIEISRKKLESDELSLRQLETKVQKEMDECQRNKRDMEKTRADTAHQIEVLKKSRHEVSKREQAIREVCRDNKKRQERIQELQRDMKKRESRAREMESETKQKQASMAKLSGELKIEKEKMSKIQKDLESRRSKLLVIERELERKRVKLEEVEKMGKKKYEETLPGRYQEWENALKRKEDDLLKAAEDIRTRARELEEQQKDLEMHKCELLEFKAMQEKEIEVRWKSLQEKESESLKNANKVAQRLELYGKKLEAKLNTEVLRKVNGMQDSREKLKEQEQKSRLQQEKQDILNSRDEFEKRILLETGKLAARQKEDLAKLFKYVEGQQNKQLLVVEKLQKLLLQGKENDKEYEYRRTRSKENQELGQERLRLEQEILQERKALIKRNAEERELLEAERKRMESELKHTLEVIEEKRSTLELKEATLKQEMKECKTSACQTPNATAGGMSVENKVDISKANTTAKHAQPNLSEISIAKVKEEFETEMKEVIHQALDQLKESRLLIEVSRQKKLEDVESMRKIENHKSKSTNESTSKSEDISGTDVDPNVSLQGMKKQEKTHSTKAVSSSVEIKSKGEYDKTALPASIEETEDYTKETKSVIGNSRADTEHSHEPNGRHSDDGNSEAPPPLNNCNELDTEEPNKASLYHSEVSHGKHDTLNIGDNTGKPGLRISKGASSAVQELQTRTPLLLERARQAREELALTIVENERTFNAKLDIIAEETEDDSERGVEESTIEGATDTELKREGDVKNSVFTGKKMKQVSNNSNERAANDSENDDDIEMKKRMAIEKKLWETQKEGIASCQSYLLEFTETISSAQNRIDRFEKLLVTPVSHEENKVGVKPLEKSPVVERLQECLKEFSDATCRAQFRLDDVRGIFSGEFAFDAEKYNLGVRSNNCVPENRYKMLIEQVEKAKMLQLSLEEEFRVQISRAHVFMIRKQKKDQQQIHHPQQPNYSKLPIEVPAMINTDNFRHSQLDSIAENGQQENPSTDVLVANNKIESSFKNLEQSLKAREALLESGQADELTTLSEEISEYRFSRQHQQISHKTSPAVSISSSKSVLKESDMKPYVKNSISIRSSLSGRSDDSSDDSSEDSSDDSSEDIKYEDAESELIDEKSDIVDGIVKKDLSFVSNKTEVSEDAPSNDSNSAKRAALTLQLQELSLELVLCDEEETEALKQQIEEIQGKIDALD